MPRDQEVKERKKKKKREEEKKERKYSRVSDVNWPISEGKVPAMLF